MLPAGFNTLLPGIIAGGPGGGTDGQLNLISNPGTSPNYCSVEYNVWFLPGETFEGIRDEIEGYVADVCRTDPWLRDHPPRFTWKLSNIYFPPVETSPDHPFIQGLAGALGDAWVAGDGRSVYGGVGVGVVCGAGDERDDLRAGADRAGALAGRVRRGGAIGGGVQGDGAGDCGLVWGK